jgi:hypothetical protein
VPVRRQLSSARNFAALIRTWLSSLLLLVYSALTRGLASVVVGQTMTVVANIVLGAEKGFVVEES